MANPYEKSFDDILQEVLTDYQNLDDAPDISEGSTPFIMGSVLSSMIWGLYRYQDFIMKQHFPDTANTTYLNRWGVVYDVDRLTDEADPDYLGRILDTIRNPKAGGNSNDYENWAKDTEHSYYVDGDTTYTNAYATCVNQDDGAGTVGLYLKPNDLSIIGTVDGAGLRAATETYVLSKQPLGVISTGVYESFKQNQSVTATVHSADELDLDSMQDAIETEINSMSPGDTLYKSTLTCILTSYGAEYANVTVPAADINTIDSTNFFFTQDSLITLTEV